MTIQRILNIKPYAIRELPRGELQKIFLFARDLILQEREQHQQREDFLKKEISKLRIEIEKLTRQKINKEVNQPTSKKGEWEKEGGSPKKKKSRKRRGRKGAGNRAKPEPDETNRTPLTQCPDCDSPLKTGPVIETSSRIIEDICEIPEKTVVSEEIQERKWCSRCAKLVAGRSEKALPKSDIGLRATVLIAYLWVVSAISLPGIARLLQSFFRIEISTAGLSRMMIRLGTILAPVHQEILQDVKAGAVIFADETGWRVKGKLWWLWIFANDRAAYYWPDQLRGSPVVEKILGTLFSGVLVTDAWCAYHSIVCSKQTCMAHIFRKIRKFRDTYPQYHSILQFYRRLRRILSDAERLKSARGKLGEEVFHRRLEQLKNRLAILLSWKNPNSTLAHLIKKVRRQQAYILTFVEHDGVPMHNNYGEYIIKKGILKRKVSGGSMSEQGVRAYACIQSIAQTCHLRQIPFKDYVHKTLVHYIQTGKPLLLSQYESECVEVKKRAA